MFTSLPLAVSAKRALPFPKVKTVFFGQPLLSLPWLCHINHFFDFVLYPLSPSPLPSFSAYELEQVVSIFLKKKKLIVPFWVSPLQSQDILYSLPSVLLNLWVSILHPLVLITSFLNIHLWLANHKAQLRMVGFCPADSTSPPPHPGALIPWFFWSCPVLSLILFTVFVRFSPLSPQISKNPCVNRKCYLIA